jgi:external thioesterase TEII
MKPQLFLLHFSGGNCYSFKDNIIPYLQRFDVFPLELPGRGDRMGEPLIRNYEEAVEDYFTQIINKLSSSKFCIYGHSMGAILGLLVTQKLEQLNKAPLSLIVTGHAGPEIDDDEEKKYLLPHEDFVAELRRLGGVPEAILELFLEQQDGFEFFELILRADFEVVEKNQITISSPIKTNIYALMGSAEDDVEQIDNWRRFTVGSFKSQVLDGDHFFINKHAKQLAAIITNCYDRSLVF